jgi:hypothetical protein
MSDDFTPEDSPPVLPGGFDEVFEPPNEANEFKTEFEKINPWIAIVIRPRIAMRYVLETNPNRDVWLIPGLIVTLFTPLLALIIYLDPESSEIMGEYKLVVAAGMVVIGGPLMYGFYMILIYLTGWLYKVMGGLMSGVGTSAELRAAFVWSLVPVIYMVAIVVPIAGITAALSTGLHEVILGVFLVVFMVSYLGAYVWWFVIQSKVIGEAHQFSAWNGFATYILTSIVMTVLTMFLYAIVFLVVIILAVVATGSNF